mmetsp:Transcript_18414/g.27209  ORF Transcript_18414/g.27209 Transcript_18414/m.27209 type:complete len:81 (-) Transcript_18414:45-287(-)
MSWETAVISFDGRAVRFVSNELILTADNHVRRSVDTPIERRGIVVEHRGNKRSLIGLFLVLGLMSGVGEGWLRTDLGAAF